MEPSHSRAVIKLIKTLSRHPRHPTSAAPPSLSLTQARLFSDLRRPTTEGFNNDDGGAYQRQNPPDPIPNRPLRAQRPDNANPHFREFDRRKPTNNGSPLQSRNTEFAADAKKKDGSESDVSFLEKFKLGLEALDDKGEKKRPKNSDSATAGSTAQLPKIHEDEKLSGPQDADEIFRNMKETGLIPNAVAMLDGLCKDGLIQEAMKLFGLMREKGTIPEVVIYTAVVDGFCKAHKLDDAKRIFRKMQNNGITPNAFSYTVLIQGLYKCNKLDDAVEYCVEMLEAGHSPNVATFVGLVDGFCREKDVEEAQSVIGTLREKGFFINDKAVREFLDKKARVSSMVWEAIFGKKTSETTF